MKIITVIGARPQFIKAATVSRILREKKYKGVVEEVIVHTGQHYDKNMSDNFFDELKINTPKYNLSVGSCSHGRQTGAIMSSLEDVVESENPDWILVYGDTNSTLAAALVAAKKPCRLAHVESGLRSYRWGLPEETNRVVVDRLSDILFCPTVLAQENLLAEGHNKNVIFTGDVMYDSFVRYNKAINHSSVMHEYNISVGTYVLTTIHRADNTDNKKNLASILSELRSIAKKNEVILSLHPRTKKMIEHFSISLKGIRVIKPIPYLTMISFVINAKAVITDSGGIQKEAYFSKTPCFTIRDETEWVETLEGGWNQLVTPNNIFRAVDNLDMNKYSDTLYNYHYGSGDAAKIVVNSILNFS